MLTGVSLFALRNCIVRLSRGTPNFLPVQILVQFALTVKTMLSATHPDTGKSYALLDVDTIRTDSIVLLENLSLERRNLVSDLRRPLAHRPDPIH